MDFVLGILMFLFDVFLMEFLNGELGEMSLVELEIIFLELIELISSDLEMDIEIVEIFLVIFFEISLIEFLGMFIEVFEIFLVIDEIGDLDEIIFVIDFLFFKNFIVQFVFVEVILENYLVEQVVNKFFIEVLEEDVKQIVILEGFFFNDFVENVLVLVDDGKFFIFLNMLECDINLEKWIWLFKDWKDVRQCIFI